MENSPLSWRESEEIIEYERVVEFAKQVQDGIHPRVKIPNHLQHQVTPLDPSSIVYTTNYYSVIGVQPFVNQNDITRAYANRWNSCSPLSFDKAATTKWGSNTLRVVDKVKKEWKLVQDAFKILSDPELRARYDAGRPRFSTDLFEPGFVLTPSAEKIKQVEQEQYSNKRKLDMENQASIYFRMEKRQKPSSEAEKVKLNLEEPSISKQSATKYTLSVFENDPATAVKTMRDKHSDGWRI